MHAVSGLVTLVLIMFVGAAIAVGCGVPRVCVVLGFLDTVTTMRRDMALVPGVRAVSSLVTLVLILFVGAVIAVGCGVPRVCVVFGFVDTMTTVR